MNALLQGLYSYKCFRDTLQYTDNVTETKVGKVCALSSEIVRSFRQLQDSTQDTKELLSAIRSIDSCRHFDKHTRQDCCELPMKIQAHWSETNGTIFNLFEGGTKYTVRCLECQNERDPLEPFTTLSLTLDDKGSYRDETASLENLLNARLSY